MGKGPRKWIKLFCYETLHGSVSYQLTAEERDVWTNLLCFAGLCGNDGIIADHDLRPFPESHIIKEINTTPEIYGSTMKKCIAEGRVKTDGNGTVVITNWKKYQSEYERQKRYRQNPGLSEEEIERQNWQRIEAWEAEHPGRKHPARLVQEEDEK